MTDDQIWLAAEEIIATASDQLEGEAFHILAVFSASGAVLAMPFPIHLFDPTVAASMWASILKDSPVAAYAYIGCVHMAAQWRDKDSPSIIEDAPPDVRELPGARPAIAVVARRRGDLGARVRFYDPESEPVTLISPEALGMPEVPDGRPLACGGRFGDLFGEDAQAVKH